MDYNKALAAMLEMRGSMKGEEKESLRYVVLSDALEREDAGPVSTGEALTYLTDIASHGCSGGSCSGLIYYVDTHAFYNEHADEIDALLEDMKNNCGADSVGEMLTKNHDVRNTLAWFGYEETVRAILSDLGVEV